MQRQEPNENAYYTRSTSEQVKTVVSEVIFISHIRCDSLLNQKHLHIALNNIHVRNLKTNAYDQ